MPHALVDLCSDTVTRPTPEMRRAMAEAEVGDDVYGEDPTVNALQDAFAERVGKEAALFVGGGMRQAGVLAGTIAPGVVRLMTHHDVDDDDVERARKALATAPRDGTRAA